MRSRSWTPGGIGSSNGRISATTSFMVGDFSRASEAAFVCSPRSGGFWPYTTPSGATARHQLGAVAAAGAHIEHLHSWANPGKFQKGQRIAPFVGLPVHGAAIRRRNKMDIIGRLRPRPEWAKKWAKNKSEQRDQAADSERTARALCDHHVLQDF